jgi:hypothetical protein
VKSAGEKELFLPKFQPQKKSEILFFINPADSADHRRIDSQSLPRKSAKSAGEKKLNNPQIIL